MHISFKAARQFLWGEVPSSKAEKWLLVKIDWFILSYCCLMYFTNYLDRSNVNNAYVSGMKQDLNMEGNQFNEPERGGWSEWLEMASPIVGHQFAVSGETESFGSNNLMGQWLSAVGGYSIEQVDYYPSGVAAFGIASTLVCATWTDYTRIRWPVLVYMSCCCTIAAICILVWDSPTPLKFFAYYLAGASYSGQATTFAWANQICADDNQERAIVLASMKLGIHFSF
ncbi:hypothetical protein ID866_2733 [Astraeus odoratus]|nr:hypothetical protein ID866_2733 [Astraeus odoratus]